MPLVVMNRCVISAMKRPPLSKGLRRREVSKLPVNGMTNATIAWCLLCSGQLSSYTVNAQALKEVMPSTPGKGDPERRYTGKVSPNWGPPKGLRVNFESHGPSDRSMCDVNQVVHPDQLSHAPGNLSPTLGFAAVMSAHGPLSRELGYAR